MAEILKSSEKDEKSQEELAYEEHERWLKDEIFLTSDRNAGYVSSAGKEYGEIYKKSGHENAEDVEELFKDLSSGMKTTSRATLETLIGYVNKKFPSPYEKPEETAWDTLDESENEEKTENMFEFEYRRAAEKQGEIESDGILEIAKLLADGNQDEFHIANSLRHLADGSIDYSNDFAKKLVDYANNPTTITRQHLVHTQGDHEGVLTNNLFNIATTFDEMNTDLSNKMFDPTITLATMVTRGSEELFGSIMDYLKFKMDSSLEKPSEK